MAEQGPQPPMRRPPAKDPVDRAVSQMARDSETGERTTGVEVVATAEEARRRDTALDEALGAEINTKPGGDAADRARETMDQQKDRARETMHEQSARAKDVLEEQKGTVADGIERIVGMLHQAAGQLEGQEQAGVAKLLHEAAGGLDQISGRLRDEDVDTLLAQARDYTRSRPGLVIGAAVAFGYLLSRLFGGKAKHKHS